MHRDPRYVPEGGALVEVTSTVIQGRYLLRPDPGGRLNDVVVGVVGRAQRREEMAIVGLSFLSSHYHLLIVPRDAEQMARFMKYVNENLSKEVGRLHDWRGPLWERRYTAIQVSNEEEAQAARLKYLLAAAVKEGLVERARDWPGVNSIRALLDDQELRGWWFSRTLEYAARRRGEKPGLYEYASEEKIQLCPLPAWAHLDPGPYRQAVRRLVRSSEREAAQERHGTGRPVLGAEAAMRIDPHYRPAERERSPAPMFHAHRRRVRKALREAYAWVVAEYRTAAERLRDGDRNVQFPEGTFPPALAFVPFARGHPP